MTLWIKKKKVQIKHFLRMKQWISNLYKYSPMSQTLTFFLLQKLHLRMPTYYHKFTISQVLSDFSYNSVLLGHWNRFLSSFACVYPNHVAFDGNMCLLVKIKARPLARNWQGSQTPSFYPDWATISQWPILWSVEKIVDVPFRQSKRSVKIREQLLGLHNSWSDLRFACKNVTESVNLLVTLCNQKWFILYIFKYENQLMQNE